MKPQPFADSTLTMRSHYLDFIRGATVVLVVVYHVFFARNHVLGFGGLLPTSGPGFGDAFATFVYPWLMFSLFLVAGISARLSLNRRSNREFFSERTTKLLVPSTLGVLAFHSWTLGVLTTASAPGLVDPSIPPFVFPIVCVLDGQGPLWFAQLLFLYSALLVLCRRRSTNRATVAITNVTSLQNSGAASRRSTFAWTLFFVAATFGVWGSAQILNAPLITVYRVGIYGFAFFLGYFVFWRPSVEAALVRTRLFWGVCAISFGVLYFRRFFGGNYADASVLRHWSTNVYAWTATLAILGFAKRYVDRPTRLSTFLAQTNFGLYVFHMFFVYAATLLVARLCDIPEAVEIALVTVAAFAGSYATYFAVRRVPVLRFLVLGLRGSKVELADKNSLFFEKK
ncbi:MAG: acyltransferase family protein [Thermoguttaceae bacterium]|nr:acyltransferase family protein [Thermoguttaceae bacterium]